jgi:hypothetical protein
MNNICHFYDTSYVCTYHTNDIYFNKNVIDEINKELENEELEISELTDYDKEFISDAVYRQEFLNILNLEEYDEKLVMERIDCIYNLVKDYKPFKECIDSAVKTFIYSDDIVGLMILFSYYNMHLTHACLCEFINQGRISDTNLEKLKKQLLN